MLNHINKFFPFQFCLDVINLLTGGENVVVDSNEVIKFSCAVTDVSKRSMSEIWKVTKLAMGPLNSWIDSPF